jgi:DNA-binding transcriptional regulator YiaG
MTFGQRVKECRKRLKMTQSQLAACCGVSRITVQNWERAESAPESWRHAALLQIALRKPLRCFVRPDE